MPNLIGHFIINSFGEPDYEIPGQAGKDAHSGLLFVETW
jgi:hypothetical protein